MFYFLLLICGLILIYYKLYKPHQYWKEKQVPYMKPLPIFGNVFSTVCQIKSSVELLQGIYNAQNTRYVGFYQFLAPTLLVKDINLIKQIGIKNFDSFPNHQIFSQETDPLFGKNLVGLKDQEWKDMRSTLSPAFTSSKMRAMFNLMSECAEQFNKHFLSKINDNETLNVEMKDIFTRYTNDVIASCAFGLKCDSLGQPNNEFYVNGRSASYFGGIKTLKFFGNITMPKIMNLLKIKLLSEEEYKFFSNLVMSTIKTREEQGIVRPDMIHLLMEAQKGRLKHEDANKSEENVDGFATVEESEIGQEARNNKPALTDEDIIAQGLIFFIAGFDTASNLLSLTSYELALNPDIQHKLQKEIDSTLNECDGKITYDALLKMKYLDMVICESLRKWPPATITDRVCNKPYIIDPVEPNESPVQLEANDLVWIPIYAIHRDPKHFPNPEKFDPERFSEENKDQIKPFSYIPFGIGPRNCIGSRFALLEAKLLLFTLLSKFEIVVIEKTEIPFKFSKKQFNIAPANGNWLGLKLRE